MSRTPHEAANAPNAGLSTGDFQNSPQLAQNQEPHGVSNFVDGSGPIFSMYMEMATEEDKKMAENWKADADGILIFTGLFSAAVASLISVSIQDIRPNPQDTSNFYLSNIYQTVADPNISTSLPASPPPFSPPNYAVWVNSLWFMSLVISLTCALLATLLQQWARRYLKVTQSRYSPHKRARIRAFFAEGVDKYLLPWAVEALPALLHISLFLFFAGLVVFLGNVNVTIFKLVLSWVGMCIALYGCITLMPIFRLDSPYYTSLSSSAWLIVTGIAYVGFQIRWWFHLSRIKSGYHKLLIQGMQRTAEETALNPQAEIDARAFMWTFDSLDEDHELERFFSGLPGFRNSKVVKDPLPDLTEEAKRKLSETLKGFLERTFSSDLLPESVKIRRAVICAKALRSTEFPEVPRAYESILEYILFHDQYRGLQTTEFGHIVRGWGNSEDQDIASLAQATVSYILVRAQRRDDSWFILASSELGVPEIVLRNYATNGDSLSLAILIHIARQQFNQFFPKHPELRPKISKVLEDASKFNVQNTLPKLRHEFCALWNKIVLHVQNHNAGWMAFRILGPIRNTYIALHQDTDSTPTRFSASTDNSIGVLTQPSLYPVCNVAGHIHDDSASAPFARTAALAPAPLARPDAPYPSVLIPLHVIESLTDVPPLSHSHPALQTTIDNLCIPAISQDLITASPIQDDTNTPTTTIPLSSLEPSASPPPVSISPHGTVPVKHIADPRISSDALDVPSLPSPIQVVDDAPITGPQASLNSPVTGSGHISSPESHSSVLAPVSPAGSSRPQLSSAPDPGTAVEGTGFTEAAVHKEMDVLDPLSTIRKNIMAVPDVPLRPPPQSPSSVTDVAIAGPSWRSPVSEHRNHPPHPPHGQYDIV